jgi:FkbM family methyltransferase
MAQPADGLEQALARLEAALQAIYAGPVAVDARWGALSRLARRGAHRLVRVETDQLLRAIEALSAAVRLELKERLRAEVLAANASRDTDFRDTAALAAEVGAFTTARRPATVPPRDPGVDVALVATDVGDLLIAASDEAILPQLRSEGSWEPSEAAAIRRHLGPGMVALDLGAHVGYRTVLMADVVGPAGRVIAIEAAPSNFMLLTANLRRRGLRNVLALNIAAGDQEQEMSLAISPNNTGDNRLAPADDGHSVRVHVLPLDTLVPADLRVDLVKCDVQGYDQRALRGLEQTLRRWHPVVVVEFCPADIQGAGDSPVEVLAFYRSLGYRVDVVGEEAPRDLNDEALVVAARAAQHGYLNLVLTAL